ncbi:MAG TPA: DUF1009 domain-containing protein [Devosia sp.]|nr:DUF1009 domain-containing protein [Devosia sp.]
MQNRLSVLAGEGQLVTDTLAQAATAGFDVQVLSLTARTDLSDWAPVKCSLNNPIGIILTLRAFKTTHICMVGGLKVSDKQRAGLFGLLHRKSKKKRNSGDTGLSRLIGALELTTGAKVIGVQELLPDIVAQPGLNAGPRLSTEVLAHCEHALACARQIGALDIGQAVVAAGMRIVGAEDIGGTDALIARIGRYRADGLTGDGTTPLILAKAKKPEQPASVDLPAIGPDTVRAASAAGISVVVIEAGGTLLIDKANLFAQAEALGVSILAIGEV